MTQQKITRNTPPSEKAEIRKDDEARAKSRAHELETRLKQAFAVTFATEDGVLVLDWIRKQCLHNETALGLDRSSLSINPQTTVYRAMQQALYLDMRKFIPKKTLMEIEYGR